MEIPLKYTLAAAAVTALVACGGGGGGVTPAAPYNYSQHNGAYSCLPINQLASPANYSSVVFTDRSVTLSNNGVDWVINQNVGFTPAGKPYYSMPYASNNGIDYSATAYIDNNQLKIIIGPSLNVPNNLSQLSSYGTGILCEKTLPPS